MPSIQSCSDKKVTAKLFAACHIIAAYLQKNLYFFHAQGIISPIFAIIKNLVLDTVRCIFVTVTLTFYAFAECSSKELQLI